MYKVSPQFHQLIADGAEQNLLIVFNDLYLSGRDSDIESGGATLTEYFNTSTDIEIGEVSSSTFSVRLMNYENALSQFDFGEGRPYIGVKTGTGTYTKPSGATAYTVWTDGNGTDHVVIGYSDHATIDGTAVSTDSEAVNIVWAKGDVVYIQAETLMYEYQYDVTTSEWAVSSGAVNPFMATKASEGVKWQNNLMTIYLDDGTTEEWEYCPLGVFRFETPSKRQTPIIDVSAYDRMALFDRDATDFLNREWAFPITLEHLFTQLCEFVGAEYSTESTAFEAVYDYETHRLSLTGLGHSYSSNVLTLSGINHSYVPNTITISGTSQSFTNADMQFTALPAFGTTTTCRDILSYIAEASGNVARFDRDGVLTLRWYGTLAVDALTEHDIAMNGYDKAEYITPVVDQITSKLANGEIYNEGSGNNVYTILANSLLASDSTRYAVILDKIQSIGAYTPIVASVIQADPSIESGDRVTIFGETVPLMNQTIEWRGTAVADYCATGLPRRELPSSLDRYGFAVAYNANMGKSNSDMLGEVHYALYADGTGLTQVVSNHTSELSNITTDVWNLSSALDDYIADSEGTIEGAKITNQHVRYGVVGYDANNDPIAGVAVGETITYTPSNNLFDVATATTYTRYFTSANKWTVSSTSRSYAFACQPSTQYTVSCSNPNISIFRVGDIAENPIPESTACQARNVTRLSTDGAITITTSDDATYIVIQINQAVVDAKSANLQIEYGDTATEYAPYTGGKDIVTIDNLGVFTARNITFYVNGNNVAQFGTNGMTLGDKWAWFVEADGSISHKYIG